MTDSKHPRHNGRIAVFQSLYSSYISGENKEKIVDDIQFRYNFDSDTKKYVTALFVKSLENEKLIIEILSKHLENWEWNRVALLDRLILQLAVAELFYIKDVPPKVTIAEAISIAKQFSTNDSSAFVNGILDAVYKEQSQLDNS